MYRKSKVSSHPQSISNKFQNNVSKYIYVIAYVVMMISRFVLIFKLKIH